MTRVREAINKCVVAFVAASLPALITGCASIESVHDLDDRVRLLECKELNRTLREVFGEPTPYPAGAEEARDYDERTIEHDERTKEHDERTIEHDERTKEHDERTIEHDERTKEHDERTKEHDEQTKEHDERTVEHDERTIEHDEVFKKLVACRGDTLELQKKYHKCERDFSICMNSADCEGACKTSYEQCLETRKNPEQGASK